MKHHIAKLSTYIIFLAVFSACTHDKTTTGYWQEMHRKTAINTGIQRTGQQVYDFKCYECHTRNTQGAPMPGDNYEWNRRYQKGLDVLMDHAINGFNRGLMPIRGGCRDCTELELRNAVVYMLNKSGIDIDKKPTH